MQDENRNGQIDFKVLTNEELAAYAKHNEAAMLLLVTKMMPLVNAKAAHYQKNGLDRDDLIQEGLIGLVAAVHSYAPDRLISDRTASQNGDNTAPTEGKRTPASFKTYAAVCIGNSILSYVKAYFRQKNLPLNNYLSLSTDDNTLAVFNDLSAKLPGDPEEFLLLREELASVRDFGKTALSRFEYKVFRLFLNGYSYDEAAKELQVSTKSIDNALQRIRRKLRKMLSSVR